MTPAAQASTSTQSERRNTILTKLKAILNNVTGINPDTVDPRIKFFEMGVDSLVLLQVNQAVKDYFAVDITLRQFFEELATVDDLASYIDRQLPQEEPSAPNRQGGQPADDSTYRLPDETIVRTTQPAALMPVLDSGTQQRAESPFERLMAQQLKIMQEQLEIARTLYLPGAAVTPSSGLPTPSAAPPGPLPQPITPEANVQASSALSEPTVVQPEPFVPYQPLQLSARSDLNQLQQKHLDKLIARYTKRTAESKRRVQHYRSVLANNRLVAGFRLPIKEMVYQIVADRAEGAHLWDIDGNRYVDLTMGFGVYLFGHGAPFITEALQNELTTGASVGPFSKRAGEVAEQIHTLTGVDRVAFMNSGTEAVMVALRVARAVTRRSKIALFTGSYHGTFDGVLARANLAAPDRPAVPLAPGISPHMIEDVIVLPYDSPTALDQIRAHSHDLAAVLVEPVQSRRPDVQPKTFLQQLRQLTHQHGIALIFDEVITGFRIHPGGAQHWFDVQADLVTYGKIIGGGMPIGVIAGSAAFMDSIDGGLWHFGDSSYPPHDDKRTFIAGTFCQHPLTMIAAQAALTQLSEQGPALQEQLNERTRQLTDTLNSYFDQVAVPIKMVRFGSLFRFSMHSDMELLYYHLIDRGVYIWEGRNCFLSTAHTDADIDVIINAVKDSIEEMQDDGFLPEPPTGSSNGNPRSEEPYASQVRTSSTSALTAKRVRNQLSTNTNDHQEPTTQDSTAVMLTAEQAQLWLLSQMYKDASLAYNESIILELRGLLNIAALEQALQQIVERHEALRTTISELGESQVVLPTMTVSLPVVDLTAQSAHEAADLAEPWLKMWSQQPFDLAHGPLVRVALLKHAQDRHLLVFTVHHIVADDWSRNILLHELAQLYSAATQGQTARLPEPTPFRKYVAWWDKQQRSAEIARSEMYWRQQFSAPLPIVELPTDHPRPVVPTFHGARQQATLPAALVDRLKQLSGQQDSTLFMTLFAAFGVLLHQLTALRQVTIGVPTTGQPLMGSPYVVGQCINMLPICLEVEKERSFTDFLSLVKRRLLDDYEHQGYSFARVSTTPDTANSSVHIPPITVMFNIDRSVVLPEFSGLETRLEPFPISYVKLDLSLNLIDIDGKLQMHIDYNTTLFDSATIKAWMSQYEALLTSVAAQPQARLGELPLQLHGEHQSLRGAPASGAAGRYTMAVHEHVEREVMRAPDTIALIAGTQELTYQDLNRRANQLARHLRQLGIGPHGVVGVALNSTPEAIITILGVLKAGCAFMVLEVDRLDAQLTRPLVPFQAIVGMHKHRALVPAAQPHVICIDTDWPAIEQQDSQNLNHLIAEAETAWILILETNHEQPLFVSHRALTSHSAALQRAYELTARDRVVTIAQGNSNSLELTLATLVSGGCVVLSACEPAHVLQMEDATVVELPLALWHTLQWRADRKPAPNVRCIIVQGRPLFYGDLQRWFATGYSGVLITAYRPAQLPLTVAYSPFSHDSSVQQIRARVPLGQPPGDIEVHLLDMHGRPVAVGGAGEIYLGSDWMRTTGSGGSQQATSSPIPHPASPDARLDLMPTGDRGRVRGDGQIELLQPDAMLIRRHGHLIDPEEVAAVIRQMPEVAEVAILEQPDSCDASQLVAWIVPAQQARLTLQNLRGFISAHLPDYLVPSALKQLKELPRRSDGQIDMERLPLLVETTLDTEQDLAAPRTSLEQTLAQIWSQILGRPVLSIHDSFLEAGGTSLLATQLISRLRETFKIDIPLRVLFDTPTIASLSERIEQEQHSATSVEPPLVPSDRTAVLPLSFAQQGLWLVDRLHHGNTAFTIPAAVRIRGPLHVAALQRAFDTIVERHETLRTTFAIDERSRLPVQVIDTSGSLPIKQVDVSTRPLDDRSDAVRQVIQAALQEPFDLQHGPLIRATLICTAEHEHVLLITMHHIISDEWSVLLFVQEAAHLYEAYQLNYPAPLPALPIQYGDFARWQRQWLDSEAFNSQIAYWKQRLAQLPALRLPIDRPRPAVQSFRGAHQIFTIVPEVVVKLEELSRQAGATLFMTLLAAFQTLLHRWTGQDDIVIGTDIAGRTRAQVEPLIGFFVNQLVLRGDLSGNPTFHELLKQAREATLGAYAHQDVPFDKLVEVLKPQRDAGRAPLFQVKLVHLNVPLPQIQLPDVSLEFLDVHTDMAQLDLILFINETEDGLKGRLEYNIDLFDPSTINRLVNAWTTLLSSIVMRPDARLQDLELQTEAERKQHIMERNQRDASKLSKFKSIKPKMVSVPQENLLSMDRLNPEQPLPLVIQPRTGDVDLVDWAKNNTDLMEAKLLEHGGLLFRGFAVNSPDTFERFALTMCSELFNENGEHPRESISGNVYTPVFYPPEKQLLWHNENSFNQRWPMKIWFCCMQPAEQGGETPLVDSRDVYRRIDPKIREQFERKQVMYLRNYGGGLGLDWQTVFQTTDKAEVEAQCRSTGMEFEWRDNDRLRTWSVRPAVAAHPKTGEMSWFNQAQHWHVACLDEITRKSLLASFAEDDLPRHCLYGDGSPIEDSAMHEILRVYQELEVCFPWQRGDIVMLDNMLAAHGRNPFVGKRKILVAMGDITSFD